MNSTLSHIFNDLTPVRQTLLKLLRPSEISGLCIVTGNILSDYERNKYMYPLNEIFYSLDWVHPLYSNINVMSLLGDNVKNLCDPRYKQIRLLCLLWKDVHIPCNKQIYNNIHLGRDTNIYDQLHIIHNNFHIYNDIEIRSINMGDYTSYISSKRIVLYFSIVNDDDIFKLSLNPISEIVNNNIDFNISSYKPILNDIHLKLPRLLFIRNHLYNNDTTINIKQISYRVCTRCNCIPYKNFSITPYNWIGEHFALSDIRWYHHIDEIKSHILHDIQY